MTDTPTDDLIRYDVMVQEALISVVRKVLQDAAKSGLPGEHHFYISFRTHAPGVRISTRLREKHPEEMTIVLQHQFWDLLVSDHGFEVGLSFGGVPERLLIPFDAMTGFFDPSVQFGLKFAADEATADNDTPDETEMSVKDKLAVITAHEKIAKKAKAAEAAAATAKPEAETAKEGKGAPKSDAKPAEGAEAPAASEGKPLGDTGAEVVSLDAFRKKK
jgi:uncharacterized protein